MKVEKILNRIGIACKPFEANLENLKMLQNAYILNVPYENLDFVFKKEFCVSLPIIYKKIVENCRGGICYESNTLFMYLLQQLGYKVFMIFAKVEDTTYIGADYPHLALIVSLDKKDFLVDVANGQNVREPMPIEDESFTSLSEDAIYKIKKENSTYNLIFKYKEKPWQIRYSFTKDEIKLDEVSSVFDNIKNYEKYSNFAPLLITQALENGRVTLTNNKLSMKNKSKKAVQDIDFKKDNKLIKDYFQIDLNSLRENTY